MRPLEEHRHLAKNGARLADDGDLRIASQDLDAALGKDIELSGRFSLRQENCSCSKLLPRGIDANIENRGHRPNFFLRSEIDLPD